MIRGNEKWGYVIVVLSALGFAALGYYAKQAHAEGVTVPQILTWRFISSALILWGWILPLRPVWPSRRGWAILAILGGIGYPLMSVVFFEANRLAPMGMVSALLYTYPAIVMFIQWLLHREQLTRLHVFSLLMALAGILFVMRPWNVMPGNHSGEWAGLALALTSALLYSLYIVLSHYAMAHTPPLLATAVICSAAGIVMALATAVQGHALWPIPSPAWGTVSGLVVWSTLFGILGFLAGVRTIGATRASIVSTVEPVGAAILGWLAFGQSMTPVEISGMGLIVAAAMLLRAGPNSTPSNEAVAENYQMRRKPPRFTS